VALVPQELDVRTVDLDLAGLLQLDVLVTLQRREAPVLADDDLLATGELVHAAAESLDGSGAVGITGADGEQDLADVDAGDGAVGLAPGATHTGLEPIGTGTGQHLVDADDVVWVRANAEMETFFTGNFDEVPRKGDVLEG